MVVGIRCVCDVRNIGIHAGRWIWIWDREIHKRGDDMDGRQHNDDLFLGLVVCGVERRIVGGDNEPYLPIDDGWRYLAGSPDQRSLSILPIKGCRKIPHGNFVQRLFFTSDGQHWRDATAGLPDSTMLTSWLHIESLDDHVYISVAPGSGTSGGLWRRPLSYFDRLEVSDRAQPAFRIEAYPNPFGDATTLRVTTDRAQPLHVAWSNVFGEEIASKDIPANANTQNILFDAKDKP